MTTRRALLFASLILVVSAPVSMLAAAGPLEVTFYYLPG